MGPSGAPCFQLGGFARPWPAWWRLMRLVAWSCFVVSGETGASEVYDVTSESIPPDLEMSVSINVLRRGKAYTIPQAARLARTSAPTVRNWLRGYAGQGHRMEPVFGKAKSSRDGEPLQVSFLELAEIIVVASYRRRAHGHKPAGLERLRTAHRFARRQWDNLEYPFASLQFDRVGPHMMYQFQQQEPGEGVLALDSRRPVRLSVRCAGITRKLRVRGELRCSLFPGRT